MTWYTALKHPCSWRDVDVHFQPTSFTRSRTTFLQSRISLSVCCDRLSPEKYLVIYFVPHVYPSNFLVTYHVYIVSQTSIYLTRTMAVIRLQFPILINDNAILCNIASLNKQSPSAIYFVNTWNDTRATYLHGVKNLPLYRLDCIYTRILHHAIFNNNLIVSSFDFFWYRKDITLIHDLRR